MVQLIIEHNKKLYEPLLIDGIEWTTERRGVAGKLTFKLLIDSKLKISEGDAVRLTVDKVNIFYGFVFTIKRDNTEVMSVTAYDQLRYLKNKDTYSYTKTASELVKGIAKDFNLNTGKLADTKYVIPSRVEDNQTLFDIITKALDLTLENTGKMYVLFDDFGKLALKSIEDMKVNTLIDEETAQTYSYDSSIDGKTYNQIKLYRNNKNTGREVYIQKSTKSINKWGVLQLYESIGDNENGEEKAKKLLELYNAKTRKLTINNVLGDSGVRAGSLVPVNLKLGDITVCSYMLVETCKHSFNEGEHWMNLTVRGGDING